MIFIDDIPYQIPYQSGKKSRTATGNCNARVKHWFAYSLTDERKYRLLCSVHIYQINIWTCFSNYTAINLAYSLPQHFSRLKAVLLKKCNNILKEIYNCRSILYTSWMSANFSCSTNIYRGGWEQDSSSLLMRLIISTLSTTIHHGSSRLAQFLQLLSFLNFSAQF